MLIQANRNNPFEQYKKSAVETATPEKLLLMLFDGAIRFVIQGRRAINERNFESAHQNLVKVQNIFTELIVTLDEERGAEIAANLSQLYEFYRNEVVQANVDKDPNRLGSVLEFLQSWRETWAETARLARMGAK